MPQLKNKITVRTIKRIVQFVAEEVATVMSRSMSGINAIRKNDSKLT